MKMNKNLQIGIAAAAVAVALYFVLPKKNKGDGKGGTTPDAPNGQKEGQDPSRPPADPNLQNKNQYTKKAAVASVDGAVIRSSPHVNNGLIHNKFFELKQGDPAGIVTDVVDDDENAMREDGKVWKWYKVVMTKVGTLRTIFGTTLYTSPIGYIREDVVNLK